MTSRSRFAALIVAASLAACANEPVSYGPNVGSDSGADRDVFIGRLAATGPDCPAMDFHLRRDASGHLGGVIFDAQNPAGRISTLTGIIGPDGAVNVQMLPFGREAPQATLTGRMENGAIVLNRVGPGCPMNDIRLTPPAAAAPR